MGKKKNIKMKAPETENNDITNEEQEYINDNNPHADIYLAYKRDAYRKRRRYEEILVKEQIMVDGVIDKDKERKFLIEVKNVEQKHNDEYKAKIKLYEDLLEEYGEDEKLISKTKKELEKCKEEEKAYSDKCKNEERRLVDLITNANIYDCLTYYRTKYKGNIEDYIDIFNEAFFKALVKFDVENEKEASLKSYMKKYYLHETIDRIDFSKMFSVENNLKKPFKEFSTVYMENSTLTHEEILTELKEKYKDSNWDYNLYNRCVELYIKVKNPLSLDNIISAEIRKFENASYYNTPSFSEDNSNIYADPYHVVRRGKKGSFDSLFQLASEKYNPNEIPEIDLYYRKLLFDKIYSASNEYKDSSVEIIDEEKDFTENFKEMFRLRHDLYNIDITKILERKVKNYEKNPQKVEKNSGKKKKSLELLKKVKRIIQISDDKRTLADYIAIEAYLESNTETNKFSLLSINNDIKKKLSSNLMIDDNSVEQFIRQEFIKKCYESSYSIEDTNKALAKIGQPYIYVRNINEFILYIKFELAEKYPDKKRGDISEKVDKVVGNNTDYLLGFEKFEKPYEDNPKEGKQITVRELEKLVKKFDKVYAAKTDKSGIDTISIKNKCRSFMYKENKELRLFEDALKQLGEEIANLPHTLSESCVAVHIQYIFAKLILFFIKHRIASFVNLVNYINKENISVSSINELIKCIKSAKFGVDEVLAELENLNESLLENEKYKSGIQKKFVMNYLGNIIPVSKGIRCENRPGKGSYFYAKKGNKYSSIIQDNSVAIGKVAGKYIDKHNLLARSLNNEFEYFLDFPIYFNKLDKILLFSESTTNYIDKLIFNDSEGSSRLNRNEFILLYISICRVFSMKTLTEDKESLIYKFESELINEIENSDLCGFNKDVLNSLLVDVGFEPIGEDEEEPVITVDKMLSKDVRDYDLLNELMNTYFQKYISKKG